MPLAKALEMMKERRSTIEPIPAFITQLERYEVKCKDLGLVLIDDDTNTNEKNSSSVKKRAIVGPSLPPNIAAKKSKSAMIGPAMPPTNTSQYGNVAETQTQTSKSETS